MKRLSALLVLFCTSYACVAQVVIDKPVSVHENNLPPSGDAILELSSSSKGFLPPRMSTSERNAISNPSEGLRIFNTDTKCENYFNGISWKQICGDCDFNPPVPGSNGPICEGQNLNLTSSFIDGATYSWTGPEGFSSSEQNPVITSATASASGLYSLTVTSGGCSTPTQSISVTVNTVTAPTALSGSGATISQFTANWSAAPNALGYRLDVSEDNSFSSFVSGYNNLDVGNVTSYPVTGLQAGTEYFYRVRSVNGCGSSSSSSIIQYSTLVAVGSTAFVPGVSCKRILQMGHSQGDGIYWIDPDSTGSIVSFQTYCDMTSDGGGWTLIAQFTQGNSFSQKVSLSDAGSGAGYLSSSVVVSLANGASQVRLQGGPSFNSNANVTISSDMNAIQRLRAGTNWQSGVNWTLVSGTFDWSYSCSPTSTSWPHMYHACGNQGGVHWNSECHQRTANGCSSPTDSHTSDWVR